MEFWGFANEPGLAGLVELQPTFDPALGWLSGLLAMLGAWALFPAIERMRAARSDPTRWLWLAGGALVMGTGLWGMLLLGLLGFQLPVTVRYDIPLLLIALLPAIAGSAAVIHALSINQPVALRLGLGALAFTLGMTVMHYVAMEALESAARIAYRPSALARATLLGWLFTLLALHVNQRLASRFGTGRLWPILCGSVLIACAAFAVHYPTMAGTHFLAAPAQPLAPSPGLPVLLIPVSAASMLALVGLLWLGNLIDSRLDGAISALRASEALNRAVIETMPDGHIITDARGTIRAVNPAAERIFGASADTLRGRPISLLVGEDEAPESGRRHNGEQFPIEYRVSHFVSAGEALCSCIVRDLSEARAAETRLRQMAAAVEQAADSIQIIDTAGRIHYVNAAFTRQTGLRLEAIRGSRPEAVFDYGLDQVDYEQMMATIRAGKVWQGLLHTRSAAGHELVGETTVTPIRDDGGRISGYVTIRRDVTEKRQLQAELQRLATAVEQAADGIEIMDPEGRIVYCNAALEKRAGRPRDQIIGRHPMDIWRYQSDRASIDQMVAVCRRGEPWSARIERLDDAGALHTEDMSITPVLEDDGQVIAFVVLKRDVTEQLRVEAQLRQAQKLEAMGQLSAGVAHEINTPVQYVSDNLRFLHEAFRDIGRLLGQLQLLAVGTDPLARMLAATLEPVNPAFLREEIPKALQESADGCARIRDIVRAMRELAHPGSEKVPTDLNETIRRTIAMAAGEWKQVASVHAALDPALPAIAGHPGELSQALLNILVNAAQAIAQVGGSEGKGAIRVSTRNIGDAAEIRISDTGPGIPPHIQERLFEPFFTTKAPGQGTGQGLPITHNIIVQRHGGSIAVDSTPGSGATFIIRLPLHPAAVDTTRAA